MKLETYGFIVGMILGLAFFAYVMVAWITVAHWMVDVYLFLIYAGNLVWSTANHLEKYYNK